MSDRVERMPDRSRQAFHGRTTTDRNLGFRLAGFLGQRMRDQERAPDPITRAQLEQEFRAARQDPSLTDDERYAVAMRYMKWRRSLGSQATSGDTLAAALPPGR